MNTPEEPPEDATKREDLLARAAARGLLASRVELAKEDPRWPAALNMAAVFVESRPPSDPAVERLAARLLARGIVSLATLVAFASRVEAGVVDPNEVL
jgi:hypothetical protein